MSELHGLEIDTGDRTPVVFRALKVLDEYSCGGCKLASLFRVSSRVESACVPEQGVFFFRAESISAG